MSRDIAPRQELPESAAPKEFPPEPCPEGTEELVPWLRKQFPEISPRTSEPAVVDRCIARSGCIDLIKYIEAALEAGREEQKENA